jgi:murein DD-endopeptidase MepM/ murein hydrolase activator NlpD
MTEHSKTPAGGPPAWAGVAIWMQRMAPLQGQLALDGAFLSRLASHVALILLAVAAVALSRVELPRIPISPAESGVERKAAGEPVTASPGGSVPLVEQGILVRAAVPHTTIPDRTTETVFTYAVEPGDSVFSIAAKFGLKPDTVMWSNPELEDYPDLLHVGQELIIIPVDGVYHEVQAGDTVEGLAKKYKVEPAAIVDYELNGLDEENLGLAAGEYVVVPGGVKPYIPRVVHAYDGPVPEDAEKGTGIFGWPVSGRITQGFWKHHRAIDIGAAKGTAVKVADSGWVAQSGWSDIGYGYFILIDHGNGFQTLYAHLSAMDVEAGDSVAKGARIGAVGTSGNSTGPHLHFEVRKNGVNRNPFGFLP